MDLSELTHDTFATLVGEPFAIAAEPSAIELVLEQATLGAEPPDAGRRPFSLVFRGPPQPLLPQRVYRLEHAKLGALEIFVVPLAQDVEATRYEAIFT